jgi:parallel beta-helix repeat protein
MVMNNVTANTIRVIDAYNLLVSHSRAGVEIGSSGSVQVSDNNGPVSISTTSNVSIVKDHYDSGSACGVCIYNSYNVTISKTSITCVDCTSVGVQYSDQVTISASKLWGNGGVVVSNSGHVAISDNQIADAVSGAITLKACGNISIQRNQAFNPVRIDHCAGVDISDNTFSLAYLLLEISSSSGMRIARNSFSNSTSAIVISNASNMTISANRIQSNREGVVLNNTMNMQVFYNDFLNNAVQAVDTYSTQNLWDNGYPGGGNFWSNYNGTDNCSGPQQNVCGRSDGIGDTPYRFSKNQDRYPLMKPFSPYQTHGPIVIGGDQAFTQANGVTGGSGSASDPYIISGWDISSGGIVIYNTRAFFVIRHVYIHSVRGLGVYLSNVANGRVEDSIVSGNGSGLKVDGSSNVTIVDNNLSNSVDAGDGMGLDISGSPNTLASGNVVSSNIQTGIYVSSRNVSVENNLVSSNGYGGIEIVGGSMIDISANNLSNNTGWGIVAVGSNSSVINQNTVEHTRPLCSNCWGGIGIELLRSTGVSVFHNNLVRNPVQACDNQNQMKVCSDTSISPNRWDDGYPSGGNFWSNYNGTDTCSGPQQNICGYPDGVGDTPMVFSYARDGYPLMKPFPTNGMVTMAVVRGMNNQIYYASLTTSWSSWQQIPGATLSTPTLCPSTPGRVDLIVRGTDNSIYHSSFTNGVWSGSWDGPGGSTLDQPSCAVLNGTLYVAVRGTDNAIWVSSISLTTSRWAAWTSLGGGTLSTPVLVATRSLNRLDLVLRGTDNGVWHMAMTGGSWSGKWDSSGGATLFTPTAVSDGSALQVVVTGMDHGVWYTSFNLVTASWSKWNVLSGSASAAPALTVDSSGNLDLVVMGTDNGIWHKSKPSSGSWSTWDSAGGSTVASPTVVQLGSGVVVLVTGTDHAVWFNRFGSGWHGWTSLGLATASAPTLSLVG